MGFSYLWHSKRKKPFEIRQNQKLEHAIAQKYLGVILDVDLKSDENIFVKIKKENVKKTLWFGLTMRICCISIVRFVKPHLEYGQEIWALHLKSISLYLKTYSGTLLNV